MMDPTVRAIREEELLENLAWVQALARRLVSDPARADDVAQEVWLNALERPPRETTGAALRAWLARVVQTVARQSFRSEVLRRRRELAVARDGAQPATCDVVARTAMQQRLVAAVMSLDEPARTTVLLHYVDGLSSRAIAERLGETPEAVRKRLSRGIARLRGSLARELGNDRRNWIHALAPLAFGGGGTTAKVALGGALVTKTCWTVGVVAAVVAFTAVGWYLLGGARPSAAGEGAAATGLGVSGVETIVGQEEEVDPSLLTATATGDEGSGRTDLSAKAPPPGPIYVITDPEDRPLAEAELVLCHDGEVLLRGETDGDGRLASDLEEEGVAKLLVRAAGWAPQVHEVSLAPSIHEVTLRSGEVVSGWITVDGGLPAERIPLALRADGAYFMPKADLGVTGETPGIGWWDSVISSTRAELDGSFRFDGLSADWSGSLSLPPDYRLTDPALVEWDFRPCSTHLDRPVEQLRIDVEKRLALSGRVVGYHEGEVVPAARARVSAVIQYPGPARSGGRSQQAVTDAEGRFRLALENASVRGGYLHLSSSDDKLSGKVELEPRELREDWDLGDVPLVDPDTTCTMQLVVLDPDGLPISGAVAGMDVSSPISEPTDAEGRTSLRGVMPGSSTIVVYAVGFEATHVEVSEEVLEELPVTMRRGALLELRFVAPNGESTRRLQASLVASRHPIRESTMFPASIDAWCEAGCSSYWWSRLDDEHENLRLSADREGRVIVNDLQPGLALHLRVTGRFGNLLQERDLAPLGPEERRIIDIRLTQGPRSLHGRVLDEAGHPVPRAYVDVTWSPSDGTEGSLMTESSGVGSDGSFTIAGLFTRTVSFEIEAPGHATLSVEDFEIPADGAPVEFRLAAGHDVMVRVSDSDGRPVPALVNIRLLSGSKTLYVFPTESEPGTYLLRNLPGEEVTIRARVHGVSYLRAHDPLVPELRIEVPVLGRLEATLRAPTELGLNDSCHLWLMPEGDPGLARRCAIFDPDSPNSVLLPDVLPGRYQAVLRRWHRVEISPDMWDAWFEEFPDDQFEELTPRVPVTIRATKTTRVEL